MKQKIIPMLLGLLSLAFFLFSNLEVAAEETSDTSLEEIQMKGKITVGTSADFPPYEFHATVDGQDQIVGMDIFIIEKIAEDLGVELEIQDIGFDSLLPALESSKVDVVIAGMSPTPEREKSVDFSNVYYNSGQNILIRASDKDIYTSKESLTGQTIGVQAGTLQEELSAQIEEAELLKLTNLNDLLLALKTNKVEAIVMEKPNAEAHAGADPSVLTFDGAFEVDEEAEGSAIAVRKGSGALIEAINQSLEEMIEQGLIEEYMAQAGSLLETPDGEEENSFLNEYGAYFLNGAVSTIGISVVSVFFGLILGILLAFLRMSKNWVLKTLATAYVEFVRGTPMMIQVMFVYFAVGYLINIPAMVSGIIAVSLNSAAYICEIIRSGLGSVSIGQTEAAISLGMNKKTALRYIIFPQAIKNIWPALGNEFITVIKESSIVSIIGVSELIFQTRVVTSISYRGILPLFITMVVYFILTYSLTKILNHYERKMAYDND